MTTMLLQLAQFACVIAACSAFQPSSKQYTVRYPNRPNTVTNFDSVRVSSSTTRITPSTSTTQLHAISRRTVFQNAVTSILPLQYVLSLSSAEKALAVESSTNLPNGLLEARVLENVLSTPPYGMEINDIIYPNYFSGVWDVESKTTDVLAPCGITLFGGNYTFTKAQKEIGTTLFYKSRFIPGSSNTNSIIDTTSASSSSSSSSTDASIIADREYNVVEIAKAAMGNNAVLDVPLASPNKVSVILSPIGANQVFQADLLTLNRRSEFISSCDFHCSEVVRQIIAPAKGSGGSSSSSNPSSTAPSRSSSLFKEIETASLYTALKEDDGSVSKIVCRQRSATFLLPSQQDPLALKMWEMSRGRPIDVRFYDIVYTKRT